MSRFLFGPVAIAVLALSSLSHAQFPIPGEGPSLFFTTPQDGETGVAVNSPVTFFFSDQMAQTHSIEWSANVNTASLTYSWMFGQALTVTPQGGFPANATITWKLNPTANNANNFKSATGTELPVGQFQGSFTTGAGGSDPGDPNDPCDPNGGDNGLGFGTFYKSVNYTQSGDQAPVLDTETAATFSASYRGASNQTVTAVSIAGPGATMNLSNTFGFFLGSRDFATPEALDAAFPAGTYTVTATGAGSATLSLASTAQIPTPRFNNLTALEGLNPTQAFTLTFAPFDGAGASDSIFISISAVGDTNEFHAPDFCKNIELPNTATSVVIPANTFKAGQRLRGQLSFSRSSFNTNAIPSTSVSGGVSKMTNFEFGGGNEPAQPIWTTITRNPDGTITYTITANTGVNLGIESSETLSGDWTQLTSSVLTTGSYQFTITPNTPSKRFYRARIL